MVWFSEYGRRAWSQVGPGSEAALSLDPWCRLNKQISNTWEYATLAVRGCTGA